MRKKNHSENALIREDNFVEKKGGKEGRGEKERERERKGEKK